MPKYPKNYHDVVYYAPGRKRPIAGSTKAVSDWLGIIHEDNPNLTVREMKELMSMKYIPDYEAIAILDKYIELGFGDQVMEFRYDKPIAWYKERAKAKKVGNNNA